VTIGESTYFVATATYNKVLAPGALTEISLSQIALDKTATNADVEAFGDTYQILVKSQGIQADGFENAAMALHDGFGAINDKNIPWETDAPTKGSTVYNAVHYLNADVDSENIAAKVSNITFGLKKDHADIIAQNDGALVDVEQDVPVYAYYVPKGNNYDVYLLADDTIYAPANSNSLFANMKALKTVDTDNLDVSRVTDMASIFDTCTSLQTVDSSNWNTGNVTSLRFAFYGCGALTGLDVSGWDLGNVTDLYATFFNCGKLAQLDVSDWDTSEVTNICHAVKYHNKRSLILGHSLQNILNRNVVDSCHLSHHALMITSSHTVKFLNRHLLPTQVMTHTEILQLIHQLTLSTTLDIEFFDLLV
jgi:surface protein